MKTRKIPITYKYLKTDYSVSFGLTNEGGMTQPFVNLVAPSYSLDTMSYGYFLSQVTYQGNAVTVNSIGTFNVINLVSDINLLLKWHVKKTEMDELNQFIRLCKNLPTLSPSLYIDYSKFISSKATNYDSAHPSFFVEMDSAKYIHKYDETYQYTSLGEIEAASAAYYRLLIGPNRMPNVCNVISGGKKYGVASKMIEGFSPFFRSYKATLHSLDQASYQQKMIDAGITEILVSSYLFAEDDLNANNFGFDSKGNLTRIDTDRSFWPLSHQFVMTFQENKVKFWPHMQFPLTVRDIENFPCLTDQLPYHWPVKGSQANWCNYHLNDIHHNANFIQKKWKCFLKATLLNSAIIENIADAYVGEIKTKQNLSDYLTNRIAQLKIMLYSHPDFKLFLTMHPEVKSEIIDEFKQYNDIIPDTEANLRIDIQQVSAELALLFPKKLQSISTSAVTFFPANIERSEGPRDLPYSPTLPELVPN